MRLSGGTELTNQSQTSQPNSYRAWWNLVCLSWQRHARSRLLVWVALSLLAVITLVVILLTQANRWSMGNMRYPDRRGPRVQQQLDTLQAMYSLSALEPNSNTIKTAVLSSAQLTVDNSSFYVFSTWLVFRLFATFLLPMWTISFSTDALGYDREAGNLLWLLTRPLSRGSIYLAKFVAALPWCLTLNLGGFAILCFAAGDFGRLALQLYWPAVLWGTVAYCALFHLMGACFRRPAVFAILYTFFLETAVGNLPDYLKRGSVSFYIRCLMYDAAQDYGIHPTNPQFFLPVSGQVAWIVLASFTVCLLGIGVWIFSRNEYLDLS